MNEKTIGAKIRGIRLAHQASLTDVAKSAGLTKSTLSKIETGQISSPVSTLLAVASALGVRLADFVREDADEASYVVTRKGEGQIIVRDGTRFGYAYETLGTGFAGRLVHPFVLTIRPGDKTGEFKHGGQEFLYMLSGVLELTIGRDALQLNPGDFVYFDPTQVHKTRLIGRTPARILTCFIENDLPHPSSSRV